MKLFYSPGACSLAVHITMRELGLPVSLEKVDLRAGKYAGGDFTAVNPKGYVPALQLDNGEILTENAAILQYLADKKPEAGLLPSLGTLDRYRVLEWLTFTSSELHKTIGALFAPDPTGAFASAAKEKAHSRLLFLDRQLSGRTYLVNEKFTVADAYLFVVLGWCGYVGIETKSYPNVQAFLARVGARAKVQEALAAEGLTK